MDCAQEELKKILKKCQAKNVNIKNFQIIENFLKENKTPETRKEKWCKIVVILVLLAYAVHYYYSELNSKVSLHSGI